MVTAKQRAARALFVKRFGRKHKQTAKSAHNLPKRVKNKRVHHRNNMARRRSRVSSIASRARGALGGSGGKTALAGLGAGALGAVIGSRFGINPSLAGGALGYVAGGGVLGALVGAFTPQIMGMLGSIGNSGAPASPSGQVWM